MKNILKTTVLFFLVIFLNSCRKPYRCICSGGGFLPNTPYYKNVKAVNRHHALRKCEKEIVEGFCEIK